MKEKIVGLLQKRINGISLSEDERKMLDEWLSRSVHNRRLYGEVMDPEYLQQEIKSMLDLDSKALWKKINDRIPRKQSPIADLFRSRIFRYSAAAALLILITTYILFVKPTTQLQEMVTESQPSAVPDLPPGTEKATLTLDDGTVLILDNQSNGRIAEQGNTIIVKEDGLLAYNPDNKTQSTDVFYNTIATRRANFFSSLVLADGTKVWLDAESSIRYPTAFTGDDRVVEVTGQIYFEVAKNPSKPFRVRASEGMTIEVLGTHFNINSYNDESAVKTTLLEGAVKITTGTGKVSFLKPGQQAMSNKKGEISVSSNVDTEETVAWKNGVFLVQNADIETVMRQVQRWYDVEVVYEGTIDRKFFADISRSVQVSKLLAILEKTGFVRFRIEGKRITVMPVKG